MYLSYNSHHGIMVHGIMMPSLIFQLAVCGLPCSSTQIPTAVTASMSQLVSVQKQSCEFRMKAQDIQTHNPSDEWIGSAVGGGPCGW
jgi:hypothetical protein